MQNNIPVFKCRASAVGKIMTNPRSKSETLSETCKTFLREWILERKYGRRNEFGSKYTDKGKMTEQDGFQLINDVLHPGVFLPRNEEHFEDDYFTGTPDIVKILIDNKSSYTLFTFPIGETEIPNKDYDGQGRVYMRLTGLDKFELCYTLNDTPSHLIEDEIFRYKKHHNIIDLTDQQTFEIVKNFVYTEKGLLENKYLYGNADTSSFIEIPKEKRVKQFIITKDDEIEQAMIKRVLECREWINENWEKF